MTETEPFGAGPVSAFLDEHRFEAHLTDPRNLAINVMVAVDKTDILDLGADLDDGGSPFDFQILDDHDIVTVLQGIAVGVTDDIFAVGCVRGLILRPFMGAHRANQHGAVFIDAIGLAFRAIGKGDHGKIFR